MLSSCVTRNFLWAGKLTKYPMSAKYKVGKLSIYIYIYGKGGVTFLVRFSDEAGYLARNVIDLVFRISTVFQVFQNCSLGTCNYGNRYGDTTIHDSLASPVKRFCPNWLIFRKTGRLQPATL